jgi:hypothetical protein
MDLLSCFYILPLGIFSSWFGYLSPGKNGGQRNGKVKPSFLFFFITVGPIQALMPWHVQRNIQKVFALLFWWPIAAVSRKIRCIIHGIRLLTHFRHPPRHQLPVFPFDVVRALLRHIELKIQRSHLVLEVLFAKKK